jgi:hypothetical protein
MWFVTTEGGRFYLPAHRTWLKDEHVSTLSDIVTFDTEEGARAEADGARLHGEYVIGQGACATQSLPSAFRERV